MLEEIALVQMNDIELVVQKKFIGGCSRKHWKEAQRKDKHRYAYRRSHGKWSCNKS
jgi:hypothetical protein